MTLGRFQKLLKKVNPKLHIRVRGWGDCGGVFIGRFGRQGYILRLSKGELQLMGYRMQLVDPKNPMRYINGRIRKRGRKTILMLLKNYRWIKNHKQLSMCLWGIEPKKEVQNVATV